MAVVFIYSCECIVKAVVGYMIIANSYSKANSKSKTLIHHNINNSFMVLTRTLPGGTKAWWKNGQMRHLKFSTEIYVTRKNIGGLYNTSCDE